MGLSPDDFWHLNPKEFYLINNAFQDSQEIKMKDSWNQTATLSYYLFCSFPKKGQNPSFKKFIKDHFPFLKEKSEIKSDVPVISPNEWQERINNMHNKTITKQTIKGKLVDNVIKEIDG